MSRWLLGVALMPLLWAVLHQTGLMAPALMTEGFASWRIYALGALTYILMDRFLTRPMWLYVVGHEMTHAITGLLSGAKIHSFKAKSTGGEVRLSKSNAFIAISPYIIPLYAVFLAGIYALTRHWWDPPQLKPVFQFLLGWTVAFHLALTYHAIHKHQSDLKVLGFFLSGVLILLGNVLILAVLGISLFSKTPTFSQYGKNIMKDTQWACRKTYEAGAWTVTRLAVFLKEHPWTR